MTFVIDIAALSGVVLAGVYFVILGFGYVLQQGQIRRRFASDRDLLKTKLELFTAPVTRTKATGEAGWSGARKFKIEGKILEADSIVSFYIAPHDERALPAFLPGQYLTFQLDIPGRPKRVARCYSLSDGPTHPDYYRVTIKRIPPPRDQPELPAGLSSSFFHENLQVGDILDVKAPSGHFYLDVEHPSPVVLIGGGIGITPVLSMLSYIVESGSNRETWLFYGVRNAQEHIMKDYLHDLDLQYENVHVQVCYSDPEPDDVQGEDYAHAERVSVDLFKRVLGVNNYDFYICGPPPMMGSLTQDLDAWGVPESRVHFEAFGPASVKNVTAAPTTVSPGSGIEINFSRSNKILEWDGSASSLLEFAEANGIAMDSGCRAGSCGTCATAIRSGEVKYLKDPDADIEKGTCLTCISVPKSALSIDA